MKAIYIAKSKLQWMNVISTSLILFFLFTGCHKQETTTNPETLTIDQLKVASTFSWATVHDVNISISAQDNLDNPIEGVRFTIYTANPDSGGVYLVSGVSGTDGVWNSIASLPTAMKKVTVFNNFL